MLTATSTKLERLEARINTLPLDLTGLITDEEPLGSRVHRVHPTDTLQGIALRYNVRVGDVKKLNRLWDDTMLYGKDTLIIPLPNSMVTSPPPSVRTSPRS